jgi:hypothetical protein
LLYGLELGALVDFVVADWDLDPWRFRAFGFLFETRAFEVMTES